MNGTTISILIFTTFVHAQNATIDPPAGHELTIHDYAGKTLQKVHSFLLTQKFSE